MKPIVLACLMLLAHGGLAAAADGPGQNPAPQNPQRRFVPRVVADSQDPYIEAQERLRKNLEERSRQLQLASSEQGIEEIRKALLKYQPIRNGYSIPGAQAPNSVLFPDVYSAACWSFALTGKYSASHEPFGAPEFYQHLIVFDYSTLRPAHLNDDFLLDLLTRFPATRPAIEAMQRDFHAALQGDATAQKDFSQNAMKAILMANGFEIDDGPRPQYAVHMRHTRGVWWGWDHWAVSLALPLKSRNSAITLQDIVQTVPGHPIQHGCSEVWDEHLPEVVVGVKRLLPEQYLVLYQVVLHDRPQP